MIKQLLGGNKTNKNGVVFATPFLNKKYFILQNHPAVWRLFLLQRYLLLQYIMNGQLGHNSR